MVQLRTRRAIGLFAAMMAILTSCGTAGGVARPNADPPATSEIIEVPADDESP